MAKIKTTKREKPTVKQIKEWRDKAKKWDDLEEKIGKFYPIEEGEEPEREGDLMDIGELAANAFGFF